MTTLTQMREAADTLPVDSLVHALMSVKHDLETATKGIHSALWHPEIPPVDRAPFINCMAAQGVEPYAKAKRKPKVVTT